MFLEKDKPFKLAEVEEEVLKFWKKEDIFRKSLAKRKGKKPFVFYEGPPYANGRPGIHHVLARTYKDIILRFRSMNGYYVPRRGGWDTHGLPVEIAAEKALGLKSKKDIEQFGIAKFNEEAKKAVWLFKDEWENLTNRIGYWLDLENAYITYKNEYIESLWWILKRLSDKKLLFQGHKVVPWCTRCGTALSSHELAQGYKDVKDKSAYVKFQLKSGQKIGDSTTDEKTYILAWTTTPWTLPGNVALAVGEKIQYVAIRDKQETHIVAKDLLETVFGGQETTIFQKNISGHSLVGLSYEPLFEIPSLQNENSHKIYGANFVTTTDGTGVVHIAPMYGEDDYQLGLKEKLPQSHTVQEDGRFINEVHELGGMMAKDHESSGKETEKKIFEILERNGNLLKIAEYIHEYPHCWRCGTAVIYYARTSWFIGMSKLKKELLAQNAKINWQPAHIKEGRFGEWLREVKDWNLSRDRFWGVPLPVWQCEECKETKVIGSIKELNEASLMPELIFVRHGQAQHNVQKLTGPAIDLPNNTSHLTEAGKKEVRKTAELLAKKRIDRIISSPLARARETAAIISDVTGVSVETRNELLDINPGTLAGHPEKDFHSYLGNIVTSLDKSLPEGESRNQVTARVAKLWKELVAKYPGERIVIVSHGDTLWLTKRFLEGVPDSKLPNLLFPQQGKIYPIKTSVASIDNTGRLDLHRPFVDEVRLRCEKCAGSMKRITEVADVWFDSGAMPFAQLHYPYENKKEIDGRKAYPADYIAEGMDQTRGWFYTLLATATALGYPAPYRNVISLGLINDKFGQKMSKSKGNIVEPRSVIDAHGVDAVRWYFYTATAAGEPKNFDEQEVVKAARRYHLMLWNSFVFYDTYGPKKRNPAKPIKKKKSLLDQWIIARLEEVIEITTKKLNAYDIREAALTLEVFLDDFSRWYIRRSRRRLQKPLSKTDYAEGSETLGQILYSLTSLTAPFTPFFAEFLYHQLEPKKKKDSVHFLNWPTLNKKLIDKKLIKEMAEVRRLATLVLAKRAELGLKVRQPLSTLKIKTSAIKIRKELLEILKDEVNIKEIVYDRKLKEEIWLDTTITEELKNEGIIRELVRQIQDLRQKANLKPQDSIVLAVEGSEEIESLIRQEEKLVAREVKAKNIFYEKMKSSIIEVPGEIQGITHISLRRA